MKGSSGCREREEEKGDREIVSEKGIDIRKQIFENDLFEYAGKKKLDLNSG